MASRRPHRTEWRIIHGKWTRSLGHRGTRVRLFQRTKDGVFYRDIWCADGTYSRKSLGTASRTEAEQLGKQILAGLLRDEHEETRAVITLSDLWARYQRESTSYLSSTESTRENYTTQVAILVGFFGLHCDVAELTPHNQEAFSQARLAGGIRYYSGSKMKITRPVRANAVVANVQVLHQMLRWATTVRIRKGHRWLERNPLEGVRRIREQNPKRPVATWERFQKVRQAAQKLAAQAEAERDAASTDIARTVAETARIKWIRAELLLILLEATGRRVGSVRQLRWEDVDLNVGEVKWRAEADKKRHEWVTPIPPGLVDELRIFRHRLGVIGGYVFPAPKNASEAIRRDVLRGHITTLETHAKVEPLDGGLFHPYRRKWATERKHLPVKDVAAAGGWRDVETLLTCYQQTDPDTILAVITEPKKLRDRSAVG